MKHLLLAVSLLSVCMIAAEEDGRIMRPADRSSFTKGPVDIVATAPSGQLLLDGKPLQPEQPFPNVFHLALPQPTPGLHTLVLRWEGSEKKVQFFVGAGAPADFAPFREHPPLAGVQCTQCHELSKRGRFVFKGGCFDCHQQAEFPKSHTHVPDVIPDCGMCHNAHGSTVKAHLTMTKEAACKQCHN